MSNAPCKLLHTRKSGRVLTSSIRKTLDVEFLSPGLQIIIVQFVSHHLENALRIQPLTIRNLVAQQISYKISRTKSAASNALSFML